MIEIGWKHCAEYARSGCSRRTGARTAATLLILFASLQVSAQDGFEVTGRHYAQLTSELVEDAADGIDFGADRIRTRLESRRGPLTGGFMLDFGVDHPDVREAGSLPNVFGDLYLNYAPDATHTLRLGQFKTPLGMDYNVSGGSMDVTKRGMETGLLLNRNLGVMLSGRNVARGFGYDLGIFNPAGRSDATAHVPSQVGADRSLVIRLHYDTHRWHGEIGHGRSERAGGAGTRHYAVSNGAFSLAGRRWTTQFEWTRGRDIQGVRGWDERVVFVHGGYRLRPQLDLVVRHYAGNSALTGSNTHLTNTYLGLTSLLTDTRLLRTRLQVNYVAAGGDRAGYTGLRGFRGDAIFVQFQIGTGYGSRPGPATGASGIGAHQAVSFMR